MFDKAKVISGLYGLVGLRQPTNPDFDIVDANNLISRSGYYSNDNPFCKVEFIIDNTDYISDSDAQINTKIKNIQESAIVEVCNSVFNEVDYIDRNFLYKNTLNLVNTEVVPAGFVGYQINVNQKKNVAFEISRVILNFKNAGKVKLHLFKSNIHTPIFSKQITFTGENHIETLGWVVDNTDASYKGSYYFGYLTNQLTKVRPVNHLPMPLPYMRDFQDSITKSIISELDIENIFVPNVTTEALWDLSTNQLGTGDCYGINPDITVYFDYTDLILRNEKLFAKAVDLAFQIKIINSYLFSLRSNRNERITAELLTKAMAEIEGITPAPSTIKKDGLRIGLLNEVNQLRIQIQKLKDNYFINSPAIKLVTLS